MPAKYSPALTHFGLLPEPERSTASFLASTMVNGLILALMLYISNT